MEKRVHLLEIDIDKILVLLVNYIIKYNMGTKKRSCKTGKTSGLLCIKLFKHVLGRLIKTGEMQRGTAE